MNRQVFLQYYSICLEKHSRMHIPLTKSNKYEVIKILNNISFVEFSLVIINLHGSDRRVINKFCNLSDTKRLKWLVQFVYYKEEMCVGTHVIG